MSELSKTEARVKTGFIILYDEGEWLVGFYAYKDRSMQNLHIFNKGSWGGHENDKDYAIDDIPQTVKDKYMFWLHMITE